MGSFFRPELIFEKPRWMEPRRVVSIPITTIAISTRISAYSTRPWPSSRAKKLRSIEVYSFEELRTEIGRASCRERVEIPADGAAVKTKEYEGSGYLWR